MSRLRTLGGRPRPAHHGPTRADLRLSRKACVGAYSTNTTSAALEANLVLGHARSMRAVLLVPLVGALGNVALTTGCETPREQPRHQADADPLALADAGTTPLQSDASAPARVGPPASAWSGGYAAPSSVTRDDAFQHRAFPTTEGLMSAREQAFTSFSVDQAGNIQRRPIPTNAPLPKHLLRHAAGLVFGSEAGNIVAIDVRTGQTAWRAPVSAGDRDLLGVVATGRAVVVVTRRGRGPLASAFDRADGRPLWSLVIDEGPIAADEKRFYTMSYQGVLTARLGTTGATAWTRDLGPPSKSNDVVSLAASRGRLIVDVPGHGLRFLDARSGEVKVQRPKAEDVEALVARDERLFVATQHRSRPGAPGDITVSAIELGRGTQLWRTPILHTSFEYGRTPLWLGTDTLYGCAATGRLFALDTRSGRLLWQYCLAFCPDMGFVATNRQPEALLVRVHDGELLAFAPTPSAVLPPVDLVVEGLVRIVGKPAPPGYHVSVGETITKTDGKGRYRMAVAGRGRIIVQALPPTAASPFRDGLASMHHYQAVPVRVPFAGQSPRHVDLEVKLTRDDF